uniref:CSON015046 protein n=1 Tax=Culicoides sonorensis TaxID=179676 RepID=A0A336K3F9_CULSO
MLQEWADNKGGKLRKEKEEAGEQFIKKELQKRATRLKNLLTKPHKNLSIDEDDEPIPLEDSSDEDFVPEKRVTRSENSKEPRKRGKRRKISVTEDVKQPEDAKKDNFVAKLSSPIKKRDSLLGYFVKMNKNDDSQTSIESDACMTPKTEPPESKTRKGRPKKSEKPENPKVEETTPKKIRTSTRLANSTEKLENVETLSVEIETPETNSNLRPRRSCTIAPKSYKFESPPSDTKKKIENIHEPLTVIVSDENSSDVTPPATKLASIFQKKIPKPAVDPEVLKARLDFLRSGLPENIRIENERQKEMEESIINETQFFPLISHVTQLKEAPFNESPDWSVPKIKLHPLQDDFSIDQVTPINFKTFSEYKNTKTEKPEPSWSHVKDRKAAGRKLKLNFEAFPTYKCFHQLHEKQKESQESACSGELFTEKYKPTKSDQFLINTSPVTSLKRFLSSWKDSKTINYDSSNDFEGSSQNSSMSASSVGSNVILIHGPCGSGKTSSVLALANEMHFNVLEINAGAKRTGKKMLQELQEATQSHQLRKNHHKNEKVNRKIPVKRQNSSQETNKKISLILIEDADIIFEQDDGFISGINQLVAISKRPVILTAINPTVPHLSYYLNQNSIEFRPPSPTSASKYLTILCLAENYVVNDQNIRKLLESNNGDMRKTVLQLQFYFQTGGDLKEIPKEIVKEIQDDEIIEVIPVTEEEIMEIDDENSKFSTTSASVTTEDRTIGAPIEHEHCNFLNFFTSSKKPLVKSSNLENLTDICDTAELLSSIYSLQRPLNSPCPDQLSCDLNTEISESLIDQVKNTYIPFKESPEIKSQKLCDNLPNNQQLSRASQFDIEPILREICRTEKQRLANERKGSRFYHYLRNLNSSSFSSDYFDRFTNILTDN